MNIENNNNINDNMKNILIDFHEMIGHTGKITAINYFGDVKGFHYVSSAKEFAESIMKLRTSGYNVYHSINPLHCIPKKWHTIDDIMGIYNIYIDLDPVRTPGLCSTDNELNTAKCKAYLLRNTLVNRGFKAGYIDMTGNGYRIILPIRPIPVSLYVKGNLRNQLKEFFEECSGIIQSNDPKNPAISVKIDSTFDPRRVTGSITTLNIKTASEGRPQRIRTPTIPIPKRVEDDKLSDYITSIIPPPKPSLKKRMDTTTNINHQLPATKKNHLLDLAIRYMSPRIKQLWKHGAPLGSRSTAHYAITNHLYENNVPIDVIIDAVKEWDSRTGMDKLKNRAHDKYITNCIRK